MVREMQLHGIEELLVGFTRELRPALALGNPPLAFSDGAHWSQPLPWLHLVRPARSVLLVAPIHDRKMRATRWRYVPNRFHHSGVESPGSHGEFHLKRRGGAAVRGREHKREHPNSAVPALSVSGWACNWRTALRGPQVRLLLAYLLLNRLRPVGREELIGALWPEDAPSPRTRLCARSSPACAPLSADPR